MNSRTQEVSDTFAIVRDARDNLTYQHGGNWVINSKDVMENCDDAQIDPEKYIRQDQAGGADDIDREIAQLDAEIACLSSLSKGFVKTKHWPRACKCNAGTGRQQWCESAKDIQKDIVKINTLKDKQLVALAGSNVYGTLFMDDYGNILDTVDELRKDLMSMPVKLYTIIQKRDSLVEERDRVAAAEAAAKPKSVNAKGKSPVKKSPVKPKEPEQVETPDDWDA